MTSKKLGIALLSLVVLAIFAVAPVAADLKPNPHATDVANPYAWNISAKDTVYIGEAGLDITYVLNGKKQLAWYASGANVSTEVPSKAYVVPDNDVDSFYVDPTLFSGRTGQWYAYDGNPGTATEAFLVEEPSLRIGLYRKDGKTSIDGKKLIADEPAQLEIISTFPNLFERLYTPSNMIEVGDLLFYDAVYNISAPGQTIPVIKDLGIDYAELQEIIEDYPGLVAANFTYGVNSTLTDELLPGVNAYMVTPNNAKLTKTIVANPKDNKITDTTDLSSLQTVKSVYPVNSDKGNRNIWGAGRIVDQEDILKSKILTGEYQFYADININGMKDKLGKVTGKTVSNTATVTVDKEAIEITADKSTVIRNKGFSVKVEGNPKTQYAIWFTGVHGYKSSEVPAFLQSQKDLYYMKFNNATNTSYKSSGARIINDLPDDVTTGKDKTGNYAVVVETDENGVATVGVLTTGSTKDTSFKIQAQRVLDDHYNPDEDSPIEDGFQLDFQLYDTVSVKVEKGAVTISASGDSSYYLGEEVTFSGTNTDSYDVYLFITGPNLPEAGGKLGNPKATPKENDSTKVNVKTDDTWEYKWDTSGSILDAGTYTVYATSAYALKSGTKPSLSDVKYDTVSIVIKKPFVTATTSASTVAKGDKLYIRGTAEGNPTQGVAVWILGKNYWNGEVIGKDGKYSDSTFVLETVNDDGSFEYEVDSGITRSMASGQYFVVVQHPMYNGDFDVRTRYNGVNGADTVQVITNPKGTNDQAVNGVAFIIAGSADKLQGSDAAEALVQAINSANIDDTYTKLTFLVEEPWIRVNSIGDHYIGDQFKITGTTNLAIGDDLIVEVTSSSFQPTQKTQSGEFSGVSSTVKVTEGSSYNEWALDVDASTFKADEYIVNVEAIEADCTTTTTFNILTGSATVAPTSGPTTAPTTAPTSAPTTAPTPAATASPGFGALVALIGLGAVAALIIRKD